MATGRATSNPTSYTLRIEKKSWGDPPTRETFTRDPKAVSRKLSPEPPKKS